MASYTSKVCYNSVTTNIKSIDIITTTVDVTHAHSNNKNNIIIIIQRAVACSATRLDRFWVVLWWLCCCNQSASQRLKLWIPCHSWAIDADIPCSSQSLPFCLPVLPFTVLSSPIRERGMGQWKFSWATRERTNFLLLLLSNCCHKWIALFLKKYQSNKKRSIKI